MRIYKNEINKFSQKGTAIEINQSYIGETIEQKIERITINKEPITDSAPIIYTPRSEGVQPAYNIRTDRFDVALEAMDKINKTINAKKAESTDRLNKVININDNTNNNMSGAQSIEAS